MSTMTRSMTSGEVELLREQRAQLMRGVRKCIERMSMPAAACLGLGLGLALGAWKHADEIHWLVPLIAFALLPPAAILGAAWHWHEFNERRQPVRECDATIQRGQVIEERHEAVRAAELNFGIYGMASIGPIERADCFYDLGNGSVLYVSSMWEHGDHEPPARGRRIRLVYTAGHRMPLTVIAEGEPVDTVHGQTDQPINLPNGTILPGNLDAVLAALGARMV